MTRFCGVQQLEAVSLLAEMFPTVSTSELVHCLSLAAGSIDVAVQHVLERMDSTDENSSSPVQASSLVFTIKFDCSMHTCTICRLTLCPNLQGKFELVYSKHTYFHALNE